MNKGSVMVIDNFRSQLTFKGSLHEEIVDCLIYNELYFGLSYSTFSDKLSFEIKKIFLDG